MSSFVDTSAFLALLDADSAENGAVRTAWETLLDSGEALWCTNYVLVETSALIQRRLGLEALRAFVEQGFECLPGRPTDPT